MISSFRSKFRYWACSTAVVLLSTAECCQAQGVDAPALVRARVLFAQGDTFSAITECKRYLFFCRDQRQSYHICREIADSLLARSAFSSAAHWLNQAAERADDSMKNEIYLASVAALLRCGNYQDAAYQFQFVDTAGAGIAIKRNYLLCKGILLLFSYQWDDAFNSLREYMAPCPSVKQTFDEWLRHNSPPHSKSRMTAKLLSVLVPGGGQAYSGDIGGAINGLFMNGITGYPAALAILSHEWVDASLYLWLFSRFYFGGLEVAADKADIASDRARLRYAQRSMENLSKIITPCFQSAVGIKKKEQR